MGMKVFNPNSRSYNNLEQMADDLAPGAIRKIKKINPAEQARELEKTRRTGEQPVNPPAKDINQ